MDVISGILKTRRTESCDLYVCVFLIRTESQNTKVSVTLLESNCTTDALTAFSKVLGACKGNNCGGLSFRCSYSWVDWTAKIFKRNTTKDVFLIIF